MNSYRRLAQALALVLTLLISGVGAVWPNVAGATQANGNTYTSKMTGVTIAWDPPWSYDSKNSTADSSSEVVFLNSNGAVVLIGYLPVGIDMNQARDQILSAFQEDAEAFTPLDRGSYSNVSYSLDAAAIKADSGQNVDFGIFTLFMGNTGRGATEVYIFMSPVQLFTDEMNSAKNNVTIGGTPIFEGVTPGGLQNLLDKNVGSSSTTSSSSSKSTTKTTAEKRTPTPKPTKEATVAPTEEASGGLSTDVSLGGSSSDKGSDNNTSSKNRSSKTSTKSPSTTEKVDPRLKELGVTAPGRYTSPQYGVKVTWNDSFGVAYDNDDKPLVNSDTSGGTDAFVLGTDAGGGGIVSVSIQTTDVGTPVQFEQYWSSDQYFQKAGLKNATVLFSDSNDSDAIVLIQRDISDTDSSQVVQLLKAHVTADSDSLVITRLVTDLGNGTAEFFTTVSKGVTVEGKPLLTSSEVKNVIAAAAPR